MHVVATGLLILEDVYKNLANFLVAHVAPRYLAKYYAYLAVSFYPVITPVAVFLSVLFVLGRMHRRNEIMAMRCAGVNILRIAKSIILGVVSLVVVNLAFEAVITPKAIDYVTAFRIQVNGKAGHKTIFNGDAFYNRLANRIWFFGAFGKVSHKASTVFVTCYGKNGAEKVRIFANSAEFDVEKNCWRFVGGQVVTFDVATAKPVKVEFFEEKHFKDFTESPKTIAASLKKIRDLSFEEVVNLLEYSNDAFAMERNIFLVKFHRTFAKSASCMIIMFLAISFAVCGAKVNTAGNTAKASIFILLFLIGGEIFANLGNAGFMPPIAAAWAVNAIAIIPIIKLLRMAI
jgi:lipopolysaccharide export system permease protein